MTEEKLWELLLPLGVYSRQGVYTAGELASEGEALDGVLAALEELEREVMLDTAEGQGLERLESLLTYRPVFYNQEGRRAALSALLRIGGDSFTVKALNDNLKGCGINAVVSETEERGVVRVHFPNVPGVPEGFERLRKIIEGILPCHLQVNYVYWFLDWGQLEEKFATWGALDRSGHTWEELEKLVM